MKAQNLYDLSLDQAFNLIKATGHLRTVLMQGHMGTGKSSLLKRFASETGFEKHHLCYFDCTTKDLGDLTLPNIAQLQGNEFVSFVPNEELGAHHDGPIVLMIDELGKANPAVKNAMMRVMLERKVGTRALHPDSVIFATTNLGSEGVGDLLMPHQRNRVSVVRIRKNTAQETLEYGINAGWDATILGWVKDNPHVMQSFEEVENPDDNPYIYHPRSNRAAFVTGRSLEAASDIIKERAFFDRATLTAALIGTIGEQAAMDLGAFIDLADKLPKLADIKANPATAPVPQSAPAVCMVVFKVLSCIDASWSEAWLTYMQRLSTEAQAMFVNGVRSAKYNTERRNAVFNSPSFTQWVQEKGYMFSRDA
jgi:MoxR-like ATPase